MTEINKQKIKSFAQELARKQICIHNEEGKGINIPTPLAIVGGALFFTPAVIGSVAAMAMGYKFSVANRDNADEVAVKVPADVKTVNAAE